MSAYAASLPVNSCVMATGDLQLVVQKRGKDSRMRGIFNSKFPPKVYACVNSAKATTNPVAVHLHGLKLPRSDQSKRNSSVFSWILLTKIDPKLEEETISHVHISKTGSPYSTTGCSSLRM